MPSLILDTSTNICLFGLLTKDNSILFHSFSHENQLAERLMPELISFLSKHQIEGHELTEIGMGLGPGSYTGTRVGATIAKTLAFGFKIPLKGFCSLLLFLPEIEGKFLALMPAKSGNTFMIKGKRSSKDLTQDHFGLISPNELPDHLRSVDFVVAPTELALENCPVERYCPQPDFSILPLILTTPLSDSSDLLYLT